MKIKKKIFQKVVSVLASFLLLINSFTPYFLIAPSFINKVKAEEPTVTQTQDLTPTEVISPTSTLEPTLIPTSVPTEEPTIIPTLEPTSTSITTPEPLPPQAPSQWTFEKVELNKEYVATVNKEVKLTFTKLPSPSGNIKIEEITLTDDQIKQTGSLSDKAYDITSDMKDGEFTYNLSLPIPESSKGKAVEIKFAEDISDIGSVEKIENTLTKTDTSVSVANLDHFTIFIITDDSATYSGGTWIDYATQGYSDDGVHYPATVPAGQTATWTFSSITPGSYKVYTSWSTHANRTTSATYTLNHTGGSAPFTVNQEQLANQTITGSSGQWSGWFYLATVDLNTSSNLVLTSVDNTSGTDYVIADEVLLAPNTAPATVWVDDNYTINAKNDGHVWGYDAFTNIQDGVTTVAIGGTINVAAGSYPENVIISKSLTLAGNNFAINPNTTSRNLESIVNGQITVYSGNVTVKGFTVTNPSYSGVTIKGIYIYNVGPVISNITIQNNILKDIVNANTNGSYGIMVQAAVNEVNLFDNQIDNINSAGWAHAIEVTPSSGSTVVPAKVTITGNNISNILNTSHADEYAFSVDAASSTNIADASQITFHTNEINGKVRNLDSVHELNATSNDWGTINLAEIEKLVDHKVDNSSLGYVDFSDPIGSSDAYDDYVTQNISTTAGSDLTLENLTILSPKSTSGTEVISIAKYNTAPNTGSLSFGVGGYYYNIEHTGSLSFPIDIQLIYNDADFDENKFVSLYYYDGSDWVDYQADGQSIVNIDKSNNIISATLYHLTPVVPGLDTTKPEAEITNPIELIYINNKASFTARAKDLNLRRIYLNIGNDTSSTLERCAILQQANIINPDWNTVSCNNIDLSGYSEGTYTFVIEAWDEVWNYRKTKQSFILDNTPPVATIDNVNPKSIYNGSTGIKVHAIDSNYLKTELYRNSETIPFKTYTGSWFGLSWLTDGNYRMLVIDKANNSTEYLFIIDKTNPTDPGTPVDNVTSPTNQTTITWNWSSATDLLSGIKNYIWNLWKGTEKKDFGPTTDIFKTLNLLSYGDGDFTFDVQSEDNAGNVSGVMTSASTTVDTVAPAKPTGLTRFTQDGLTEYTCGSISQRQTLIPTWTANSETDFDHYEYTSFNSNGSIGLNEQILTTNKFVHSWVPTSDGVFGYAVRSVDKTGNKSDWSLTGKSLVGSCQITYDSIAPTGTVTYSTTTLTNSNVTATLVPSETVTVTNNGGSTSYIFTVNGTFTFNFRDLAGNTGSAIATVSNIDKISPVVDITAPTTTLVKGNAEIRGTVTDTNPHHYWLVIQNSSNATVAGPGTVNDTNSFTDKLFFTWNTALVPDGVYKIKLEARDAANNKDAGSATVKTVTVDNTAPVLSSQTTFSGWYNTSKTSTFTYSDTNGVASGNDPTCDITTEGTNQTCSVTPNVCDVAGNCNTTTITSNGANMDFTDPSSEITTPSNSGSGSTKYMSSWSGSIEGTATDTLSDINNVKISIQKDSTQYYDGTNFIDSSTEILLDATYVGGNWEYNGLTSPVEGSYTIRSHAIDNATNMESTYTLTIILDKTIPEVAISLNPAVADASNGWYKTQPEITLTATDTNFEKIEYQWNSETGTWTTYSSPFKPGSEGSNVLYYRAQDKAGNYSGVGIKNIKWDQTELTDGPLNMSISPNPTSGTTSVVKWEEAKDNIGIDRYEIKWSLKNGDKTYMNAVGNSIREHTIDNLTEGVWNVYVTAFDGSGNSKNSSVDLTVDRTGPSAPQLSVLGTAVGSVSLGWSKIDEANNYIIWYGTTPGSYQYGAKVGDIQNYTVQGLGTGSYYFIVKAVDSSGNQSGNSNEVSTGTIIGTPGIAENTPAEGFAENVLGEATGSAKLTPTGTVLGMETKNSKKKILWWQWILILLFPVGVWFGYRKWKNRNN